MPIEEPTLAAPADTPNRLTLLGSPPKTAIFRCTS